MKKALLLVALIFASSTSLNTYAHDTKEEAAVTLTDVAREGIALSLQTVLALAYFEYVQKHIVPKENGVVNKEASKFKVFDGLEKGLLAVIFCDRAKSFFKTLSTYVAQEAQPVTNAVSEVISQN